MSANENTDKKLFRSWNYGKINYLLFGIGLIVILFGYIIMALGETTSFQSVKLAPFLLTIAYCIIIPLAILIKPGKNSQGS